MTENLAAALRRLRRTVEPRWLWIDAICIDQNIIAEKSQQVAMMGEIYKRANVVLIWLGEPDVKIKTPIRDFRAPNGIKNKSLSARRKWPLLLLRETLKVVPSRWWDRTWVLQEFLVASSRVWLQCGRSTVLFARWNSLLQIRLLQRSDHQVVQREITARAV